MHPILFRIPLPDRPLKLWWGMVVVAAIAAIYTIVGMRKKDRATALGGLVFIAGAAAIGYVYRAIEYKAPALPIYSYGVMLGLSLVVGWYLTLTLAERDGLPKETMANCYVITAIAAIVGSRILYILTNIDEFRVDPHDTNSAVEFASFFALRRGGLVAYGGFLGGYLGSWSYLRQHKIRLMPWADVAVPSLASGLFITRIGCYLFGCDFGKRLSEGAPPMLKKLGTFPHWAQGTLEGGEGSPAWYRHHKLYEGTPLGAQLDKLGTSFPVHPTQIYESLIGLFLLGLLLWQRKHQKFRGQIFFLFAFGYGYLRFLVEILRDDTERGEFGPVMAQHWLVSGSLMIMTLGFVFGISLGIANARVRQISRVVAFLPPIVAFLILRPESFGKQTVMQLSTSQWIGFASAVVCSYFYAQFWEQARRSPKLAMTLESLGDIKATDDDARPRRRNLDEDEDDDEATETETEAEVGYDAPVVKKKKGKRKSVAKPAAEPSGTASEGESADADDDEAAEKPEPEGA